MANYRLTSLQRYYMLLKKSRRYFLQFRKGFWLCQSYFTAQIGVKWYNKQSLYINQLLFGKQTPQGAFKR